MAEDQQNRPHRKTKDKKEKAPDSKNPKAHAFAHPGRLQRQAARSHDVREKRLHVPLVDRLPEEAPPLIVAVVGPPKVGKTTLIKSLVRRYTKQTLSNPTGPLTVVTSKRRRLTFIECPGDSLAAMMDVAKVVDIVLLMIDGKYGFEMETMEFLNILSSSGMPGNVFGILTKLDLFKKQDTLKAQKKRLKHRFWSELYQGAKLFYLSGVVNGRYPDREVLNLSRFLSVMKNPRPLVWRNSHPYCLADRFLDITPPMNIEQNPKCDRVVALYGYLRGINFSAQGARVHIPGAGDFTISNIEALPDPCPTPFMDQALAKVTGKTVRKRLGEKQKVLFAPMSDVGGVSVDKDAVYIDVKTSTFDPNGPSLEDRGFGEKLVIGLQSERRLLGEASAAVRLFENQSDGTALDGVDPTEDARRVRRPAIPADVSDSFSTISDASSLYGSAAYRDNIEENENSALSGAGPADPLQSQMKSPAGTITDADGTRNGDDIASVDGDFGMDSMPLSEVREDEDGDMDEGTQMSFEEYDSALQWKSNLAEKAKAFHAPKNLRLTSSLMRLMYDSSLTPAGVIDRWHGSSPVVAPALVRDDSLDSALFKQRSKMQDNQSLEDHMIPRFDYDELQQKWTDKTYYGDLQIKLFSSRLRNGGAHEDDAEVNGHANDTDTENTEEAEDDFVDLEVEAVASVQPVDGRSTIADERERNAKKKEDLKLRFEEEDREGFGNDKTNSRLRDGPEEVEYGENDWYDARKAEIQKQLDINQAEFREMDETSRIRVEGHKAGTYGRIVLEQVPYEFSASFSPKMPIIVGGLNPLEDRFGFVHVSIKRHRWHQRILKTNDPLIFSLGWRRFQTVPIYSIHENRIRHRMLKYTPEHMHCSATFYGPLVAPNTPFCCAQSFSGGNAGFRVAATGVVLNVDGSTEIVKKLKLKGYPHKVYKNTAIIKDMFTSELEIAKFRSGNLRTVSGVRGMIKGGAGNKYPAGHVRAGFEDKILMSDIVFLSAWRSVKPRELYVPVTNLLGSPATDGGEEWTGMRLTGEVRREQGLKTPQIKNSAYRPVERAARHFNPLRVPRKLQAELPFKNQIGQMKPQKNKTYLQKRAVVLGGEEKRARDLMQKLTTLRKEKVAKRVAAQEKRREPYRRKVAENLEKKASRERREKSEYWQREGKKRKGREEGGGGGKRRKT